MSSPSVRIFLSAVSDEFRDYREALRRDLTRPNVEVKIQEDFKDLGGDTLDKLDQYIANCDVVVHLVGDMTGSAPKVRVSQAFLKKHPEIAKMFPDLSSAVVSRHSVSYTQWEAWLTLSQQGATDRYRW
jgi:Domain of unknown function (DUF4062)